MLKFDLTVKKKTKFKNCIWISKFDLNKGQNLSFIFYFLKKLKIEEQIRFYGKSRWCVWSQECLGTEKIWYKNEQKFIFQFLLKSEIGIWDSFFNLIMKTKNEKNSNLYFILKQKSNVPFDPRIVVTYLNFVFLIDVEPKSK